MQIFLGPLVSTDAVEDDLTTEDVAPRNDYLSKKDVRNIVIGLVLVAVIGYPLVQLQLDNVKAYQCRRNLQAVGSAMLEYSAANDERLPFTFVSQVNFNLPRIDEKGRPYTWASTLMNMGYFDHRRTLECPNAQEDEGISIEGYKGKDATLDYGMYAGLDGASTLSVDQTRTVLVAETSNGGVGKTYDPVPLRPAGSDGPIKDNFLIGWSNGDDIQRVTGTPPPPSVTRLAYRNTLKGVNYKSEDGRHGDKINVLFADGHVEPIAAKKLIKLRAWDIPLIR